MTRSPRSPRPSGRAASSRRPRPALVTLALAAAIGVPTLRAGSSVQDGDLAGTRTALEKWVETRRIISRERRDWALGKQLVQDQIDITRREIDTLRERITEAEGSIAEADKKRVDLVNESDELKGLAAVLHGQIETLETRTRALLARLPDPIRQKVKPFSQSIPEDPASTKQGLGERFQNIVAILNEVNKFQREIHLSSEVLELADGTTAEVTAMYVGLGQSYYATAHGDAAGVGTAGADAWVWRPADESAAAIARAIAILRGEPAEFVPVPVQIDGEGR